MPVVTPISNIPTDWGSRCRPVPGVYGVPFTGHPNGYDIGVCYIAPPGGSVQRVWDLGNTQMALCWHATLDHAPVHADEQRGLGQCDNHSSSGPGVGTVVPLPPDTADALPVTPAASVAYPMPTANDHYGMVASEATMVTIGERHESTNQCHVGFPGRANAWSGGSQYRSYWAANEVVTTESWASRDQIGVWDWGVFVCQHQDDAVTVHSGTEQYVDGLLFFEEAPNDDNNTATLLQDFRIGFGGGIGFSGLLQMAMCYGHRKTRAALAQSAIDPFDFLYCTAVQTQLRVAVAGAAASTLSAPAGTILPHMQQYGAA